MACTENRKRFWKFSWFGPHRDEISRISRFGAFSWAKYEVTWECARCKCMLGMRIMEESDLVRMGFDIDKLHAIDRWSESAENLKKACFKNQIGAK